MATPPVRPDTQRPSVSPPLHPSLHPAPRPPLHLLLHPLHAILLAFPIALFSGALATDITYLNSAEIQWTNFSSWLIAGGCLMGGLALLWAIVLVATKRGAVRTWALLYMALLAVMWLAGLVNAFQHSHDGWSSVETTGLVLSIVSTLLALAAGWVGYSGFRVDERFHADGSLRAEGAGQ